MPPRRPPSDSDSESGAPETISLSQSKKLIKQKNSEIRKAGALVRQKIKLKNREKDQKLKERAALNQKDDKIPLRGGERREQVVLHESKDGSDDDNEDGEGEESFDSDVEARMLRAMKDAEGEDEGEGSDSGDGEEFAEFQEGSSFDGDHAMNEDDEDERMGHAELPSSDDDDTEQPQIPANYLPDEVFKAAFSQATKPKPSQSKKKAAALSAKQQKKYKRSGPKDIMVGSKAIRTLASSNKPVSATAAVPSSKINRFLNRTLALKGQRPVPGKGWERRPANIGVLRRNGPPAHFVRKN